MPEDDGLSLLDLLRLACICGAGAVTSMSCVLLAHVLAHRDRPVEVPRHVIPVAVSYTLLAVIVGLRVYTEAIGGWWFLLAILAAYAVGGSGLWIIIEKRSQGR